MSDYKSGQIAMVTALNRREEYRAFFDGRTWRELGLHGAFCVDSPTTIRPLVVLDLEAANPYADPDVALESILSVLRKGTITCNGVADQIEAQTRPAIEEPKGLGAVVEDAKGRKWVRTSDTDWPWDCPDECGTWSDFTPVRVLSEGVPA